MTRIMKTMDGNEAAAYAAYAFTEVAAIYPITPSSQMADFTDVWAAQGKINLFGMPVKVIEMQSEGGAAGSVHGSLQAGALTTTFTASQGLLLKIPNMYKIAGQLLPGVIHVSARTVANHALSIFGDHSDVYAARQTGFAMLASGSVQQVMDLGGIAHLAAIRGRVPFMHFFDGFRTSHEMQKIELMDYAVFDRLLDKEALQAFRDNALSPDAPQTRGVAQNDDIYFQNREACNRFYEAVPDIVAGYMEEISQVTGREYRPFVFYGHPEAERVIVAMGSVTECIREVVDYLNARGEKVGLVAVHLFRPFSVKYLMAAIPASVQKIAVLDRAKEPGAVGEPLLLDVRAAFYEQPRHPVIVGGRYGLASKNVNPGQIAAVFKHLEAEAPRSDFTIGIVDDVTYKSLPPVRGIDLTDPDTRECLFYGLGADGTVGANKSSVKIIGEATDLYAQAYFAYDSKKSGGFTRSYLRFGKKPIRSTYYIAHPHFVACSVAAYLERYEVIDGIRENGVFLLNSIWDAAETVRRLPDRVKRILARKKVRFYILNATALAEEIGLGKRSNTLMQSAFFKLAGIIDYERARTLMKERAERAYHKKGEHIVEMNYRAIDLGAERLVQVPVDPDWGDLSDPGFANPYPGTAFVETIAKPTNANRGNVLPVSAFVGREDGAMEHGSTAYEKRGIAVSVPIWKEQNCTQCNQCVFVCPHAVIRPFLLTDEELAAAPEGIKAQILPTKGKALGGLKYRLQISPLDCTGCELCVAACPVPETLEMAPLQSVLDAGEQANADYLFTQVSYKDGFLKKGTQKGSGFAQPLFEFHAACPGCGETPYITLLTRLYGDSMMIANGTGCSSIYGASSPSAPYRKNSEGRGPAWANSLFEDNAEFGFGMHLAYETIRRRIECIMTESLQDMPEDLATLFGGWIQFKDDRVKSREIGEQLVIELERNRQLPEARMLLGLKRYFARRSQWVIGGDGWAYDIGYGGLDHVLASGANIKMMVLDTEVYSNTGGQSSKASRTGVVAQFSASGKPVQKKELGYLAMTYGNIYVAQINSGASPVQTLRAIEEAESYDGPALLIAYSPCIAHGIRGGLSASLAQAELASKCGYWPLYTYDPRLSREGKNPVKISGSEPDWSLYESFLLNEVRYGSLKKINPEHAAALFEHNKKDAQRRFRQLKRLAHADFSDEAQI